LASNAHDPHGYREGVNAARRAVAADVLSAGREHDAAQSNRLARFRNVEPETAELLGVLVRAVRAVRVLELGTSNGYSTIWLADGVEAVGGRIVSVDVDAERIALARGNLERAGLEADLRVADAAEVLARSARGTWDLVFLDADRGAYVGYWPDLLRALRFGGLLVVDNVLSHANEVAPFLSLVSSEPAATSTQVPIGAGVQLIVKSP
jgi:predicted O-methyltransferase YrrM